MHVYRWHQEDGTTALPVKAKNSYKLPGSIGVCEDSTFKKLIELSLQLFEHFSNNKKVVISPLPRFILKGCCPVYNYSVNTSNGNYSVAMLDSVTHLRKSLKLALLVRGVEKEWVADGIKALLSPGTTIGSKVDAVTMLCDVFAVDGVHFMQECYSTMAQGFAKYLECCFNVFSGTKMSGSLSVSGSARTFYWRGFCSPVGSTRLKGLHWVAPDIATTDHTPMLGGVEWASAEGIKQLE